MVGTRHCRVLIQAGHGSAVSLQLIMVGTRHCRFLIQAGHGSAVSLQLIMVGTRHCRVLISGNINSNATGNDITSVTSRTLLVAELPSS